MAEAREALAATGVGSGSPLAEAAAPEVASLPPTYKWKGKTYREKAAAAGVNSQSSFEDVLRYVELWPPNLCAHKRDVSMETPYQSIDDFVNTMRQSSSDSGGAFLWPSERFGIMRAIAVTLHHLPVTI